ncbi:hypothetical protein ATL17_1268 [Maritalea mobilis]|uniref:Uncharacterized protein n=1 Tax=Maritalea mobilis TaxID=483324 RepID=A0A4R6VT75_9HYPH|nr:hypothetical protein [Maritalea mobilis]TDQ67259.1 hypothetical protein ATL17_1268 [Maritalea mobilis]
MILYKTIALKFGHHLENADPVEMIGPDGEKVSSEETRQQWQAVLNDLSSAKIYLLDHNAANYLDSLRMDVQGLPSEKRSESRIQDYVRDVDLPRELIWIEYDDRKLWEGRIARGVATLSKDELSKRHQRGFLFDNRPSDKLTVRLFSAKTNTLVFDAPLVLEIAKSHDGRPNFNDASWQPQRPVIAGLMRAGLLPDEAALRVHFEEYNNHLTYEMVIGFMLFAALAAREDDLASQEFQSLTKSQAKTARKFGKTWMTDAPKSHITIRIGPAAERHMTEQLARLSFEKALITNRAAPIEHWVAEHERQYSNGKVVRVRAHKRGRSADGTLPARVMGPLIKG